MLKYFVAIAVSVIGGIILMFIAMAVGLALWGFDSPGPPFIQNLPPLLFPGIVIITASGINYGISRNWKVSMITILILIPLFYFLFGIGIPLGR